jgi:periplasmic protein TonB
MTNKEILQADILDILFENRNKAYGAYALRKKYNHHLRLAIGFALSIVLGIFLVSFSWKKKSQNTNTVAGKPDSVVLIKIPQKEVKPVVPPRPHEPIHDPIAQSRFFNNIQFVRDSVTRIPTQTELEATAVSNINKTGNDPATVDQPVIQKPGNNNVGEIKANGQGVTQIEPSEFPPSYPGGLQAFKAYLSRHLVVPEELESGDKKTVIVHFLVDIDGSISRIEIIQSGGNNFDKEVIRVLNKMPKWNPAVQNGHKVGIGFTQPVTFVGVEQ